jgi:hypothetical protein
MGEDREMGTRHGRWDGKVSKYEAYGDPKIGFGAFPGGAQGHNGA